MEHVSANASKSTISHRGATL